MYRPLALVALLAALGCGSSDPGPAPAEESEATAAAPRETIRDETHWFHKTGLIEAKVIDANLGGKDFMPGGNFAEYEKDGKKYSVFFAARSDNQQATFLSMDYRDILTDQKFLAHFGGYFGMDGETPTLVFPKGKYVVVISGLELEEADEAGRMIAGYIR